MRFIKAIFFLAIAVYLIPWLREAGFGDIFNHAELIQGIEFIIMLMVCLALIFAAIIQFDFNKNETEEKQTPNDT
jgi:Na+/melibiose symporter-like transporter